MTEYKIGGHLIDVHGVRHTLTNIDTIERILPCQIMRSDGLFIWVDPSHYVYEPPEPPKPPKPTNLEVGQVWEREDYEYREVVLVGKNGVAIVVYHSIDGIPLLAAVTLEELLGRGWKLKEGA